MRRYFVVSVLGAIFGVGILAIVGMYGSLLSVRVAPGLRFQILGPSQLVAGQATSVTWNTSPESRAKYPHEKIEICRHKLFGRGCITLLMRTLNNGQARVVIPNIASGSGFLRMTARDKSGKLLPAISTIRPVRLVAKKKIVIRPQVDESDSGGSGGGGGSSDSASSRSSEHIALSTSVPAPTSVVAPPPTPTSLVIASVVTPTASPVTPTPEILVTGTPLITVTSEPTPVPTSEATPIVVSPTPTPILTTANITSPTASDEFTSDQTVPVTLSGTGLLKCGTWKLIRPSGEVLVFSASDFVSGQLPGNIPAC